MILRKALLTLLLFLFWTSAYATQFCPWCIEQNTSKWVPVFMASAADPTAGKGGILQSEVVGLYCSRSDSAATSIGTITKDADGSNCDAGNWCEKSTSNQVGHYWFLIDSGNFTATLGDYTCTITATGAVDGTVQFTIVPTVIDSSGVAKADPQTGTIQTADYAIDALCNAMPETCKVVTITTKDTGSLRTMISTDLSEASSSNYVGHRGKCIGASEADNKNIAFQVSTFDPATDKATININLASDLEVNDKCYLFPR
jgi:hypothetical protein